MFQYTSETIINTNEGGLNGKRFAKVGDQLVIDGVTNVKIADIKKVYHTPYAAAVLAKAEITVPDTVAVGNHIRFRIRLTEQGNSRSILQNAYLHKNKPFTYEVIAAAAGTHKYVFNGSETNSASVAEDVAYALAEQIKRELAETDFRLFTISIDSTTKSKIVIEAADEYIRFADARGVALPVNAKGGVELFKIEAPTANTPHLVGDEGAVSLVKGNVVKMGNQGAGTVKRLIKDLRIPTSAKTDPFELKDGGMPIPGGKYDQYLLEVETKRRHIAGGVVGSINESLTSFVLFIESGIKSEWNSLLTAATSADPAGCGLTVEEAGPQASRSDVAVDGTTGEVTLG